MLVLASALVGLPIGAAWAQGGAQEARTNLETKRQLLEDRKRAEKDAVASIGQLRIEREQLNKSLIDKAREIQASEAQLSAIEARTGELEAQERILKGSLATRHDHIARLLAAMQRMGRNPPPVMITKREDALAMVRSAMMLARTFPEMREQALALAGQLNELARVKGDIQAQADKQKSETQRLSEQRTQMALLLETKRQSLDERQSDLVRIRKEAVEIAKGVADLNELITRLDRAVAKHTGQDIALKPAIQPDPTVSEGAGPTAAEPREVAAATLPAPAQPAALPPAEIASPGGVPRTIEIAPKGTQVASLSPGRLKPALPFTQTQGTLQFPVQGRKVLAFGDKTQGDRSKGIVLETRPAGQVTAPVDAWVVFAGEFRTFGQLLIINAGDGYHILLAGLSHIDVQLGEFVLTGQPVGVMGGSAKSAKGQTAETNPVLYIEFRKDGRPVDPDPWWAPDARQKVQG